MALWDEERRLRSYSAPLLRRFGVWRRGCGRTVASDLRVAILLCENCHSTVFATLRKRQSTGALQEHKRFASVGVQRAFRFRLQNQGRGGFLPLPLTPPPARGLIAG
jgi:hypothetical protein